MHSPTHLLFVSNDDVILHRQRDVVNDELEAVTFRDLDEARPCPRDRALRLPDDRVRVLDNRQRMTSRAGQTTAEAVMQLFYDSYIISQFRCLQSV